MAYQAKGAAMRMASATNLRKSLESKAMILATEAPNTFRMPISLVRWEVVYATKPNRPKQASKTAKLANKVKTRLMRFSLDYIWLYSSSRNV